MSRQGIQRLDPASIAGGIQDNGPISTEGYPVFTEARQYVLYIRSEIVCRPVLFIGFRYQTAHFAHDVWIRCQRLHLLPPGIEIVRSDDWFGDMIEHKGCVRALTHQFDDAAELVMINTDIERETILRQQLDASYKARTQTIGRIGF